MQPLPKTTILFAKDTLNNEFRVVIPSPWSLLLLLVQYRDNLLCYGPNAPWQVYKVLPLLTHF